MSDASSRPVIAYDDRARTVAVRAKLTRALWVVIACKVVMVVLNTVGAFSQVADVVRWAGVGVQVSLTVVFLVLLFRLTSFR